MKIFRFVDRERLKVQLQWDPCLLFLGVFWRPNYDMPSPYYTLHLFICLVPMVPIHVTWLRERRT